MQARKALLAGVSTFAISVGAANVAAAQGMAVPPMPVWQGLYAGGHAGYGWADMDSVFKNGSADQATQNSNDGFLLGLHAGYNWHVRPRVILGIEGDVSSLGWEESDQQGPDTVGDDLTGFINSSIEALASIRGRLGFLTDDATLLYITGGLGFVQGSWNVHDSDEADKGDFDGVGGVVGLGVERRVRENVSVGLEGLWFIFDEKHTLDITSSGLDSSGVTGDKVELENIFVVRARASFRF